MCIVIETHNYVFFYKFRSLLCVQEKKSTSLALHKRHHSKKFRNMNDHKKKHKNWVRFSNDDYYVYQKKKELKQQQQ